MNEKKSLVHPIHRFVRRYYYCPFHAMPHVHTLHPFVVLVHCGLGGSARGSAKCEGGSGAGCNGKQSHGGYSVESEIGGSRWRATRGGCGVPNARGGGRGPTGCRGQGGHDKMGEGGDVSIGLP